MAHERSRRLASDGGTKIQLSGFVVSMCICLIMSVFFLFDASEGAGIGTLQLESRVNPNDAPASSLVRLPGIGPSKAAAIIAYREQYTSAGEAGAAFQDCNDLQKVRGIGPKTVEAIAEWVIFD